MLERSFTVRFRCLLDNTSGFLVSMDGRVCACYYLINFMLFMIFYSETVIIALLKDFIYINKGFVTKSFIKKHLNDISHNFNLHPEILTL